jgi:hypothetical protein
MDAGILQESCRQNNRHTIAVPQLRHCNSSVLALNYK